MNTTNDMQMKKKTTGDLVFTNVNHIITLLLTNNFSSIFRLAPTYAIIFGPDQGEDKELFLTNYSGKVLYVSPKAVNTNYSLEENPRNTLVIFEDVDSPFPDCRESNLQTVSTVQKQG